MSGSEVDSVNSSSNATDTEEVLLFECRLCKQKCTAAEKDSHRVIHNISRQKRKRVPSPDRSEVPTLFQQVGPVASSPNIPVSAEIRRRDALKTAYLEDAKKKAERRAKSEKRRSKKTYDKDVVWVQSPGS